jgi:seryl-tRNA synthetase
MLDIKFIRENPDRVKQGCQNKQVKVDIDRLLDLDRKRRECLNKVESLRAEENRISYLISREADSTKRDELIKRAQQIKTAAKDYESSLKEINLEFEKLMLQVPNLPLEDVPKGESERNNVVLRSWGKPPKFKFKPRNYLEIAEKLDLIDVKRAAKVSGTRFGYLKNEAVLLEFALINFAFEILLKENFHPILPPVMINEKMARGMGYIEQLDREEAYFLEKDKLYLVGTAEQSIGPYFANEILKEEDLPKRFIGFSTCFRREAGAYGKDTKGIFRVHQFDKVEMFSFCRTQDSRGEHQFFLKMEEKLMQALKIPYRVVQMCTGDLGFPAASKYDIEAWLPSENRYRETHSTSNCTDFQARRLNIRYKNKVGKLDFVHTVNGTAFAIGRTLIAIIENYQQKDGSILVPKILQKYLKFKKIGL